jgi:hypothetical protein
VSGVDRVGRLRGLSNPPLDSVGRPRRSDSPSRSAPLATTSSAGSTGAGESTSTIANHRDEPAPQCRHRDDACCESPGHVRRLHFWNGWTRVMIRSSGQGCGDADLRGQGLMNGATFGDVQ